MANSIFIDPAQTETVTDITISGTGYFADGLVTAPSRTYTADTDLGNYRIGANNEGFSAGGALIFDYNASRVLFAQNVNASSDGVQTLGEAGGNRFGALYFNGSGFIKWNNATTLIGGGDNILEQRNGTNAQTFRVYNTISGADSEFGFMNFSGNQFQIGTSTAGAGTARNLNFITGGTGRWQINTSGHLLAVADNTYDFGAPAATRPRTGYFGTSVVSPAYTATSLLISATAPTIASGFGSSPSIPSSNGTAAFTINVGTGGTATGGVLTMPAATTGWIVTCVDITNAAGAVTVQTAGTTTSVTLANYSRTTGLLTAWAASDIIRCIAIAY